MSDFGVFTNLDGLPFDAINSFTSDYVIDVFQVSASGSRTYPLGATYKLNAYIADSPDTYQGGGQYAEPSSISVSGGVVSWRMSQGLTTVVVTMQNV